jgi:hypothetical protein
MNMKIVKNVKKPPKGGIKYLSVIQKYSHCSMSTNDCSSNVTHVTNATRTRGSEYENGSMHCLIKHWKFLNLFEVHLFIALNFFRNVIRTEKISNLKIIIR